MKRFKGKHSKEKAVKNNQPIVKKQIALQREIDSVKEQYKSVRKLWAILQDFQSFCLSNQVY